MAPRAILLDALGTLITIDSPVPRLVGALLERHGLEVSPDDAARALRAEMAHYRRHCIAASDFERLEQLRLECASVLAGELGGEVGALAPEALLPTLLASLRFVAFPEVAGALERWRAAGSRLVVASNWDISLHGVLEEIGLRERLDAVATSAEVGAAKPAGELFAAALALAGAQAWQAVHIGDSLLDDVEGAQAAGIEAVWLRRAQARGGQQAPHGVRVIATLDEL